MSGLLPILLLGGWLVVVLVSLLLWRRPLMQLWREPVLRHPVLIVESDDWGAGPAGQTTALARLEALLLQFRDPEGRPPVMTLALVLAVADGPAIARDGQYHRITLCDARFQPLREALQRGSRAGVFALQLHGMEHYWPETLMASDDPVVRQWREAPEPQPTEALPAPLQSRWTDARRLPSHPLPGQAVKAAVAEEVEWFRRCLREPPRVVVPPTFVWDRTVEQAWVAGGVRFVVTPGRRNGCRDADGHPGCTEGPLVNGQPGRGVTYLVRDRYFEPERGHSADQALAALAEQTALGRPCLLETHRSNFLGPRAEYAFEQLQLLFEGVARAHPDTRFLSTETLGEHLLQREAAWVETRLRPRLHCWCLRAARVPRFGRLARIGGLLPLLQSLTRPRSEPRSP